MDAATETQEDLIFETARGNREAFRRLYDLSAPRMLGIAHRMLLRRDLAEEAVQEAFVAVWKSATLFDRTRGTARAWLGTIIRRKAIDRLRASPWLRQDPCEEETSLPETEEALALRQCLEALEEAHRRVIVQSFYLGLSHEELSRLLKTPLGTVKSWIRRGLINLRRCMAA